MTDKKLGLWIGVIEISYRVDIVQPPANSNNLTFNGRAAACTVVTTWASSYEDYSQKCSKMVESYDWTLLEVDKANAVRDDVAFSAEIEDMLERTRGNPSAIIYGIFNTYPVM